MRSTFTEYKETQQAREDITAAVLKHTFELCSALEANYHLHCIRMIKSGAERFNGGVITEHQKERLDKLERGISECRFTVDTGRKYHKIWHEDGSTRSVHAFIDKKTGEVYKPASYKAPAKGVRFDLRIIEQREWLFDNADWAGSYLYIR